MRDAACDVLLASGQLRQLVGGLPVPLAARLPGQLLGQLGPMGQHPHPAGDRAQEAEVPLAEAARLGRDHLDDPATLLAHVAAPADSTQYWSQSLLGGEGIGNLWYFTNQSISGVIARIFEPKAWTPETPLRVVLIGTDFEVRVWETLLRIPVGCATTYGDVANHIGRPSAARWIAIARCTNQTA